MSAANQSSPTRRNYRTAFGKRERRYPIWSARAILGVSVIAVAITAALVFAMGQRSPLVELEITLAIVAAGLFLLLSIGLYRGARVKKHENLSGELKLYSGDGLTDHGGSGLEIPDIGGGDDFLGCLAGLVIGILVTVLFVVLLVVFVNVAIVAFFLFMLTIGWIFHRALRTVFSRSKQCRGDIVKSLGYAAFYTFLYTGWLLGILLAVQWLRNRG